MSLGVYLDKNNLVIYIIKNLLGCLPSDTMRILFLFLEDKYFFAGWVTEKPHVLRWRLSRLR